MDVSRLNAMGWGRMDSVDGRVVLNLSMVEGKRGQLEVLIRSASIPVRHRPRFFCRAPGSLLPD